MSDTIPSPEAIRLSNALDNLGAAALDLEGYHDAAEKALVDLVWRVYQLAPAYVQADVFGCLRRETKQAVIRAARNLDIPSSFTETIIEDQEVNRG
jgi:hypothetical protein